MAPALARIRSALVLAPPDRSGPDVARLFHLLLGAVFLVAFVSLGVQVQRLIGSRGLLPLAPFLDALRERDGGVPLAQVPTLFWIASGDRVLAAGIAVGIALSLAATAGFRPRLCFAVLTALYLGYAVAARTFLSFQWDNLLLECGLLAAFLPADRPAPLVHFLFRVVAFKLYFESGIAKWQSNLHDWHDGSAMTYYYETAPLPTWLGWYAHNLPRAWHHFESRATLALELCVPFAIFGPRRARLGAAAALTLFQVANAATANYGFFCYLAAALHAFLLADRDVPRPLGVPLWRRLRARFAPRPRPPAALEDAEGPGQRRAAIWRRRLGLGAVGVFIALSVLEAAVHFGRPGPWIERLQPVRERIVPLRLVNTYHLFAAITRERIEPEVETWDGAVWTARDLRYKAGDPTRRPAFVAPHQPRLDFQLWFYGLDHRRREPLYVANLVHRICRHPKAVSPFFASPLPASPEAVRLRFWQYHFTTPAERRASGAWWRRTLLSSTSAVPCDRFQPAP